jgi:tetratricopeptide (TPR) repeat protein
LPAAERDEPANLKFRAHAYFALKQWSKAIETYSKVIALNGDDKNDWMNRGHAHAEISNWDKASTDFAKAIALGVDHFDVQYYHALTCAGSGDAEGYRRTCQELVQRFAETRIDSRSDMILANRLAGVSLVKPGALESLDPIVVLCERGVKAHPGHCVFYHVLGSALYRSGKYETAIKELHKAMELHGKPVKIQDALFMAMAHYELRHIEESKNWLATAIEEINRVSKAGPVETDSWDERLARALLRSEAEHLINDPPVGQSKKP